MSSFFAAFFPAHRRGPSAAGFLLIILMVLAPAERGWAQLGADQRTRLAEQTEAARQTIGERPFPSAEDESARVVAAVQGVADYLRPRSSAENAAKWLTFLVTEPLIEAIREGASREEIADRARVVRNRLIGDRVGLELAPMTTLRDRVDHLLFSLRFEGDEASVRLVDQRADALQKRLIETDPIPSPEDASAIGGIVALLEQSGQMPELVDEVRRAFSQPNLLVSVDGTWIGQLAGRPVDQHRSIRDCILGTTIIGNGHLLGNLEARLAPSRGSVQLDLILTGRFDSDTVGYNGPVRLPTVGRGQTSARRSVWIDEQGVRLSPTTASASLSSQVTSVQHPLKIVRKIARKKVAQQQPRSERIAERRLLDQVSASFDKQTSEATASRAPLARFDQARVMLKRFNLSEPVRTLGSTDSVAYLEATVRDASQISAPNPPPARLLLDDQTPVSTRPVKPSVGSRGPAVTSLGLVTVQVHESLIDNVATRMLAGRTVTGKELDRLLAETGREPEVIDPDADDTTNFVIDFSGYRPVICELRDQTIRLGIRGTRFRQGDRELKRPLEITATYHPVKAENGVVSLVRSGEVDVAFPGTRRLTVQQVAVRRTIQRLFGGRFPVTLLDRPLFAPDQIQHPEILGRAFRPGLIDARDGWLSIAIR